MKKVMNIEGMRCPHCSANVEKALCALEGVKSAVVDLVAKTATVEAEDSVSDAALAAAVDDLGFDVKSIA
ncbi:MAG: heavy-metal-associated domain-containing protein [Mailhella sp.]|nr:heavy-metal-associated domain-containing protein [Mailhella sp.]